MTDIDFGEPVTLPTFQSYSQMSKFNDCPQAWHYRYLRHLDQAETVPPVQRDFGSWWHAVRAADSLIRGRARSTLQYWNSVVETTDNGPTIPSADVVPDDVFAVAERWWNQRSEDYRALFIEKLREPLPDRLRHLDDSYRMQRSHEREHELPVGVEVPLELTFSHGGRQVRFTGFIDEIYRDDVRGFLVIRDHKTHASLADFQTEDDIMDSQLHLYAWAAEHALPDLPGKIRATAYDRVRSVAPRTPSVTKSGTLSKSVTDYPLETYLAWCADGVEYPGTKKDGSGAGVYTAEEKVVEKLSSPEARGIWFKRSLAPVNRKVVRVHVEMMAEVSGEMPAQLERINERHEAQRRLTRGRCRWCPFNDLCRAQMYGGPDGVFQIEDFGLQLTSETDK